MYSWQTAPRRLARRLVGDAPPAFGSIAIITIFLVLGIAAVAPALPLLAEELELSAAVAALILASFPAGRLLFTVPGGMLVDRFGFRPVAIGASAAAAAAALSAAVAPVFEVLIVAQIVQGMASSAYTTGAMAMMVTHTDKRSVGRLVSTFQGLIITVVAFSPLVGGFATAAMGISGPFWVLAIGGAVAVPMSIFALPSASTASTSTPRDGLRRSSAEKLAARVALRGLFRQPAFRLSLLVAFTMTWTLSGPKNTLVPMYANLQFGSSEVFIGITLTVGALATVVSLVPAGRLIDRLGRRPLVRFGTLALAVTVALHWLAISPALLIVTVTLIGLAKGTVTSAPAAIVADVAPRSITGAAMGVSQGAVSLGLMMGPVSAGWLADVAGPRDAFLLAGGLVACCALVAGRIPETLEHPSKGATDVAPDPTALATTNR